MAEAKRVKKNNLNSSIAMLAFTIIIGFIAVTVYFDESRMLKQEEAFVLREETLNRQIAEEEARTRQLETRKKYVTTKQYTEEIAREKLGLLNPDEILIKAKED